MTIKKAWMIISDTLLIRKPRWTDDEAAEAYETLLRFVRILDDGRRVLMPRNDAEFLVRAALKAEEISRGKAAELLYLSDFELQALEETWITS
jgi:hypothetical protein